MTNENITFTASLGEDFEGKSNKKARVLSALLSSVALGVFLEGCAKESEGDSSFLSSSSAAANASALGNPASLVVSLEETSIEETPLPAIVDVDVEGWRVDTVSLVLTDATLSEITTDASDEDDNSLPLVLTDATLSEITTDASDEDDNSPPLVLTDATLPEITTDASDEVDDSLPLVLTDATLSEITTDAGDEVDDSFFLVLTSITLLEVTIDAGDEGDGSLPLVLTDATLPEVATDAGDEVDDPFIGADRVTCGLPVDPWTDSDPMLGYYTGDRLYSYGGLNNLRIVCSGEADSYDNLLMSGMFLGFYGDRFEAADFASDSGNFVRDGNDLVITIKSIDVTIKDAFDTNPDTGTGNSAFTIFIEFDDDCSAAHPVTEGFWHFLA